MPMTASTDKSGPRYICTAPYRRVDCSSANRGVGEDILEEQISEIISRLELPRGGKSDFESW